MCNQVTVGIRAQLDLCLTGDIQSCNLSNLRLMDKFIVTFHIAALQIWYGMLTLSLLWVLINKYIVPEIQK